ncbi:MAG: tetraacyldisaccharide 4'-kinase [Proteobacteria bacterium]|jgi:tetraacyldisaccharide 4'-kinase|nr:tetraacyldisaccharide 4'-kinase [Alphaproteobacteria bacterium]NCC02878.1 tetraacyldisaccharide 4'-kinase [Pseudomonadota bacterium]
MKAPAFWSDPKAPHIPPLDWAGYAYRLVGKIRRALAKPYTPKVPLLCIGNIVAGGAGKTPTALALHRLFLKVSPTNKPVFVTRGYGGSERGPLRVDPARHTVAEVGDEALLLAQEGIVWMAKDRVAAIREAEREATHIILDDGLQNPNFTPTRSILVVDGPAGFGNNRLIPAGPLREMLADALARLDAVLIIGEDHHNIAQQVCDKPVCHARFIPSLSGDVAQGDEILAFAGIGRPQKFYDTCREAALTVRETASFPDHHPYTRKELDNLLATAQSKKLHLVTTAKDYVRLPPDFRTKTSVLNIRLMIEDEGKLLKVLN